MLFSHNTACFYRFCLNATAPVENVMKKIKETVGIIMLILSLCTLCACDGGGKGEAPDGFTMRATVIAVRDKIEVEVTEAEYASGIYEIITPVGIAIRNSEGTSLDRADITVGSKLIITYNGQTMLSLPPQVVAREIVVVS